MVVALVNLLPEATYHVFLDNLFSSCDLFRRLRQCGHGATGTARRNCGLYEGLVKLKAADNTAAGSIGFNEVVVIPTPDNQVNQIAWKDNSLVLFLSTVFKGDEVINRWRKRPTTDKIAARLIQRFFGDEPVKLIPIPSIAAAYNDEMNAVDRGDQMRAYWGPDRPVRRGGWKALAWDFLLEIALINSFILQQQGQPQWRPEMSQVDWRQRIVNSLIETYAPKTESRQRFRTGDEFTPILQHNLIRRGRSECLACQGFHLGQPRPRRSRKPLSAVSGNRRRAPQSRYRCQQCNVALCRTGNCWNLWHHQI